jgi:hypothetical protein
MSRSPARPPSAAAIDPMRDDAALIAVAIA